MALLDDSSDVFERITSDIEHLLNRLTQINNNMSDYIKHIQNPSAVYTVQRHREILNDYSNEFRKTRSNIVQLIEREQLIQVSSNKKSDDFKSISSPNKITKLYMKEQEHLRK